MQKILICFLIIFGTMVGQSFAYSHYIIPQHLKAWGGGVLKTCSPHTLESSNACLGENSKCEVRTVPARGKTGMSYSLLMMLAVEYDEHGAKFCPIQAEAGMPRSEKVPWVRTEYAIINDDCVWLCKQGWTGENCAVAESSVSSCDAIEFNAATYKNVKHVSSGANYEWYVAMFQEELYEKCSKIVQEHSLVLGIVKWTPSGHGAFAQQLVVHAVVDGNSFWNGDRSKSDIWVEAYPASSSTPILVCKNGYKPNPAQTDCIAIKDYLCLQKDTCADFKTGFNENLHKMIMRNGCYQYRCSGEDLAFESTSNHANCVPCIADERRGINPDDGTCVSCEMGYFFDDRAKSSGFCAKAVALSHDEIRYGVGKNRNNSSGVLYHCWTKTKPEDMRQCILDGGSR